MTAPFAKVPHSAVMITTARELRVYIFRCATSSPVTGLSRWPVERLAVRMGLTYDSVAKAEKALIKLGFLGRGEDKNGTYWRPKDPDPMNLWSKERAEYIPSSEDMQGSAYMQTSDGNHPNSDSNHPNSDSNHPNSDGNHPRSARDKSGKQGANGKGAGGEELGEESKEESGQESGKDASRQVEKRSAIEREMVDISRTLKSNGITAAKRQNLTFRYNDLCAELDVMKSQRKPVAQSSFSDNDIPF